MDTLARVVILVVLVPYCIAMYRALKSGKIAWHAGAPFAADKAKEPFNYWFLIVGHFALLLFFIWVLLPKTVTG